MQVQYEPSSVALQTTLSPASFADPIWTRNEQSSEKVGVDGHIADVISDVISRATSGFGRS